MNIIIFIKTLVRIDKSGLLTAKNNGINTIYATAADGSGISQFVVITIYNQPVYVENIVEGKFKISGNPADKFIYVHTDWTEYKINYMLIGLSGNVINEGIITENKIDVSYVLPGVYLLILSNPDYKYFEKIVVE